MIKNQGKIRAISEKSGQKSGPCLKKKQDKIILNLPEKSTFNLCNFYLYTLIIKIYIKSVQIKITKIQKYIQIERQIYKLLLVFLFFPYLFYL